MYCVKLSKMLNMKNLKTESFIAGYTGLYDVVLVNPQLQMIPINHLDAVRDGLYKLGYKFRVRYRGPHKRNRDTLKCNARAFSVYLK